jgi:hypothetical protein
MVTDEPMSEFKFACPVCGQHITADSSTSGGQIECPTCFQKIVVPQAPASAETKFILSASQVGKPRPVSSNETAVIENTPRSRMGQFISAALATVLVVCVAGAGAYVFRDKIADALGVGPHGGWSLNLKNATFPATSAAGKLRGQSFAPERFSFDGRTLSLREGSEAPLDMGIAIAFGGRWGGDFSGRTVEIVPEQRPPVPRVTVSWKDGEQHTGRQVFTNGYALKLSFGQITEGQLSGRIYLCLPDETKSVVAGTFSAAVRKGKGSSPKGPKPKSPPPISGAVTNS